MSLRLAYIVHSIFLFVLINAGGSISIQAQNTDRPAFGISFSPEVSEQQILNSIPELKETGIQIIELRNPVSSELIQQVSEYNLQILVRSNLQFLTAYDLKSLEVVERLLSPFILEFSNIPVISGIGLASFSTSFDQDLISELHSILPDSSTTQFYVLNRQPDSNLNTIVQANKNNNEFDGENFLFEAPFISADIQLLNTLTEQEAELILFDYFWFEQALQTENYFQESLKVFIEGESFLLPSKNLAVPTSRSQWPVIVLILLWLSLGIHLRSVPTYRPLIFRYFTFHRFFVDDIMRYRERSSVSGIFLLVQHAFFTGLVVYILAQHFISAKGLEALYHHFPLLSIFGENYFSLFIISIAISFLIEFLGLFWLYFPSKSMQHFSQTINLYSWVFHLDFLVVSAMLISLITGGSTILLSILGASHFIIWLTGFLLAAFDSSKYLVRGRFTYMMNTFGLHSLINLLLIVGFFYSGYFYDVISLATSL